MPHQDLKRSVHALIPVKRILLIDGQALKEPASGGAFVQKQ